MFQTAATAAFFAAWRALCDSTFTPHYRTAFQELPVDLLPRLLVLELASEDKYIVRFMGTAFAQMWGKDLTGTDGLALMPPPLAAAARRNLATMLDHPCGLYHVANYITHQGREVMVEHITVPASNDPVHPKRLVTFADEISTLAYGAPTGEMQSVKVRTWLDVGAGVPSKPPAK